MPPFKLLFQVLICSQINASVLNTTIFTTLMWWKKVLLFPFYRCGTEIYMGKKLDVWKEFVRDISSLVEHKCLIQSDSKENKNQ